MALPQHVTDAISHHLNEIGALFRQPKITLVVRAPQLDDGDLVMTSDEPAAAIKAIERLVSRAGGPVSP